MCIEIETIIKTEIDRSVEMKHIKWRKSSLVSTSPNLVHLEDNNRIMLYEQKDIAKRWKEYSEIL